MLIFSLLAIVVAGLAMLLPTSYDIVALAVFPILWGLGLAIATTGRSNEEKLILARLFTISFLLRVALAIAIYRFGLVNVLGDEDSSGWYGGWAIAQAWRGDPQFAVAHPDFWQALYRGNQGYYYLAGGFLYLIGAPSRVSLAFLSAFAGGLTSVLVYLIGVRFFGRNAAEKAGLLAAVFPSLVTLSAQTLKESFVILFECAIVYAVIALRSRASLRLLLLLLVSLFCLYTMRFYAADLSGVAAVLVLLWPVGPRRQQAPLIGGLVLSAAIFGLFASGLWKIETERLGAFNLDWIQSFRTNVATGTGSGSGILLPYDVSTPQGALLSFPVSLISFLLSPFPWQVLGGSARLKFAMIDMVFWWWLIPKVLVGLREAWRSHREAIGPLMLFILPLTVLYALMFGNAGLAFRERGQILVLLFSFAGLGLSLKKPEAVVGRVAGSLRSSRA